MHALTDVTKSYAGHCTEVLGSLAGHVQYSRSASRRAGHSSDWHDLEDWYLG